MEGQIDGNASLYYATIQIFPVQNRYEVFVCGGDEVEKLAVGVLENLLPHLPGLSKLYAKRSNAIFKLQVVEGKPDAVWFTKSTLHRFLKIVGSPKLLNASKIIESEISQLEEARNFHFSLYAQGKDGNSESGETDESTSCRTPEPAEIFSPEENIESSDASKSELLRAMDSRLTALRRDFAANLNQAAGAPCLSKELSDLITFCEYFGAASLQVSLSRLLTLTRDVDSTVIASSEKQLDAFVSTNDKVSETHEGNHTGLKLHSETPVKYGVSPSMLAQIERESYTESEGEFSDSSDHLSASRSRSVTKSAPPRRSASPMRRIQIGRNGSRRAAALTIKTLSSYPARERIFSKADFSVNDSEGEGSEQPGRKPENSVRRMSVQDAISLFESKQKDQTDSQKNCSLSNASLGKNKSVLRRWSAGVTECSNSCQSAFAPTDSDLLYCNEVENKEILKHSSGQLDFDTPECQAFVESATVDVEIKKEKEAHDPVATEVAVNTSKTQVLESKGRLAASAEWCEQKKVELEKMLLKMTENKPMRNNGCKKRNTISEQRGGFYDHYKEKRNEKLRGENAGKRAEKAAQFKAMQQTLNQRKAEMTSKGVKDVAKKQPSSKPQKPLKNQSQAENHRIESPKTSVAKVSKTSVPPPSRKLWPSTSSTRATGTSPSKSPAGLSSSGPAPTRRKPQSTLSQPPLSVKTENSRPQRNRKGMHTSGNNNLKRGVKDKVQQPLNEGAKTKAETVGAAGDSSDLGPSKTRFTPGRKKAV